MLRVSSISKSFDGNRVLRDVSFELEAGELVGVVGPSGCGKSVLLKILGEVLKPDSGSVKRDHNQVSENEDGASVGFLFQEGALFDSMTVLENTAYPLTVVPTLGHKRRKALAGHDEAMKRSLEIQKRIHLNPIR